MPGFSITIELTFLMFQNAFALLQRSETHAIMADTGARLAVLMHVGLETVACPPAQYFQGAAAEIQKHSKDNQLGIEEAMLLLESFEKEADKKMDITTAEALTGRLLHFYHGAPVMFEWQI